MNEKDITRRAAPRDFGIAFLILGAAIALGLPMDRKRLYQINVEDGRITCSFDEKAAADFRLSVAKGDISLKGDNIALVGDASKIVNHQGKKLFTFAVKPENWQGAVVEFDVKDGNVLVD